MNAESSLWQRFATTRSIYLLKKYFEQSVDALSRETEEGDDENRATRLQDMGQLMISSETFISMGVGEGGASGLRLNEDLTRGSTSRSLGFDNEELVGPGIEVFDVGLVEVYRFIRDVDNKPVDGDVDPWKGVFE